jgi:hypothetical protein
MSDQQHETPTELQIVVDAANRLNEENAQLRDEIGRYRAAAEESDEERRRRWGQQILDGLDASGPRSIRL